MSTASQTALWSRCTRVTRRRRMCKILTRCSRDGSRRQTQPSLEASELPQKLHNHAANHQSRSRTQHYGFSICVSAQPIIHFGAKSETDAFEWMSAFRQTLWPPNKFVELEKSELIDNCTGNALRNSTSYRYHVTCANRIVINVVNWLI